jgi:hypothetical protein
MRRGSPRSGALRLGEELHDPPASADDVLAGDLGVEAIGCLGIAALVAFASERERGQAAVATHHLA